LDGEVKEFAAIPEIHFLSKEERRASLHRTGSMALRQHDSIFSVLTAVQIFG
jgi:hypothetical protein